MSMPFYAPPEQVMKDRADFARKGIARGRSVVVASYAGGVCLVAENPSATLHKLGEVYDRIAFAGVGKYNEFESLRVAGIRYADLRGYSYDRSDVTARGLVGAYAQTLGAVFTQEAKPYEVEILLAQVGKSVDEDQIYRVSYDGSISDERGFVGIGGTAEAVTAVLREGWSPELDLAGVVALAGRALAAEGTGTSRSLAPAHLEVAVLDRTRPGRRFRRIVGPTLERLLITPSER